MVYCSESEENHVKTLFSQDKRFKVWVGKFSDHYNPDLDGIVYLSDFNEIIDFQDSYYYQKHSRVLILATPPMLDIIKKGGFFKFIKKTDSTIIRTLIWALIN